MTTCKAATAERRWNANDTGSGDRGSPELAEPTSPARQTAGPDRRLQLLAVAPDRSHGVAWRLLADPGIVRNRAKIEATINNARRYGELAAEFGSLAAYVWQYEPDPQARPPVLDHAALLQLGHSPESTAMSKDLRRRRWSFVGPTTVYAFMQAMGLVNDHLEGCDRRAPVERERHRFRRPSVAAADGTDQSGTADGRP